MCRLLSVSRSAYYAWLHAKPSKRELEDSQFKKHIKNLFDEGYGNYGTRNIARGLKKLGIIASRRHIARLMQAMGVRNVR